MTANSSHIPSAADVPGQTENVEIAFAGTPNDVIAFLHGRQLEREGGIWRIQRDSEGTVTSVAREHDTADGECAVDGDHRI